MNALKAIQTEIDTAYLYQKLSENEGDENIAKIFHQMSEIEMGHAMAFVKKHFNKLGKNLNIRRYLSKNEFKFFKAKLFYN